MVIMQDYNVKLDHIQWYCTVLKVLAVYHLLHFSYQIFAEYYITPVPLIL